MFWLLAPSVQFQGVADIIPADDVVAREVYQFKILFTTVSVTDPKPKECPIHVHPTKHINKYGVGVSRMTMVKHFEEANRRTSIPI